MIVEEHERPYITFACASKPAVACEQRKMVTRFSVFFFFFFSVCVFNQYYSGTPSVLNYKSFQEYWRVKPSQSLTKIIERNIKIYDIKYVHYENIANKKSNNT
jgi:hypothetical protein